MKTSKNLKIDLLLVKNIIEQQFPQWKTMEIKLVKCNGLDNKTFHLGNTMLVRMPTAKCYALNVLKEQKWLKILKPHLSLTIPEPIALGRSSKLYPWNWSIYKWIEGVSANLIFVNTKLLKNIAVQLANFLNELHTIPIEKAPKPGPHNFWRGGDISIYDQETKAAIVKLTKSIDTTRVKQIWDDALKSHWTKDPVWIHGDLASGNFLVKNDNITAIIDFENIAIGDPACDLVIAWTLLDKQNRNVFKSILNNLDDETWNRAKGWALWKALITIVKFQNENQLEVIKQQKIINEIVNCDI